MGVFVCVCVCVCVRVCVCVCVFGIVKFTHIHNVLFFVSDLLYYLFLLSFMLPEWLC